MDCSKSQEKMGARTLGEIVVNRGLCKFGGESVLARLAAQWGQIGNNCANWQEHKLKFSEDQLVVMTDLLISPNYYA